MSDPAGIRTAAEWLVVHTRPRCEKKFAELVQREKLKYELPLVQSIRRYQNQTKRFEKPLFPGYVFVEVQPELTSRLYQGEYVARLIRVKDQATFLRQLEFVRRLVASGMPLVPAPVLVKGTRVRIVGGPLHGVEGSVENASSPRGVVLAIDVIQQGVVVYLPPENIEVIA